MITEIYFLILLFFLIGAIGFWRINRKRSFIEGKRNWIKYLTYFIIIHLLFFSIVTEPGFFRLLSVIILCVGLLEMTHLFKGSGWDKPGIYFYSILVYSAFAISFLFFGWLQKEILLFTVLISAGFDAFSQISGQLLGRHKLFPKISPSKTIEGLLGGIIVSVFVGLLIRKLLGFPWLHTLLITVGVALFAFIGDFFTSWYKRQYGVKDFSNMLPGHGGFLDRFDSLIAAGAFMSVYFFLNA
jgi:phosphatidate cytidylyltransferase